MNQRVKKKLVKRDFHKHWNDYRLHKLIHACFSSQGKTNISDYTMTIPCIIGRNLKHPHKILLLKNCYPSGTSTGLEEENHKEYAFECSHSDVNIPTGQVADMLHVWRETLNSFNREEKDAE